MAVVFFHIPRTSGSTVWHTLIRLAPESGVEAFDLYHRSRQLFGSAYFSIQALKDQLPKIAATGPRAIVHHHTNQNITAALCPEEHKYVTILRDPAERLISETFHLSAIVQANHEDLQDDIRYLDNLLSPGLLSKLADPSACPDDLVARAAAEPFYRNYYINAFWQLLFGEARQDAPALQPAPEDVLPALAFAVGNRFHFIGRFAKINDSVHAIAGLAGMTAPPEVEIVHIKNGSRIPPLRPETVELVRTLNKADYEFVRRATRQNAIGLARRLAETEAMQPQLEAEAARLAAQLAASERQSIALAQELATLQRSKSWRLTRPLRDAWGWMARRRFAGPYGPRRFLPPPRRIAGS
jgi:hypothetical protein